MKKLADQVLERLAIIHILKEKGMVGRLTFMVNDKTCIRIIKVEIMYRIKPEVHESLIEKRVPDDGFHQTPDKGYVVAGDTAMKKKNLTIG